MTTITEKILEDAKSKAGGWTKAQLALIGVAWPPVHGWKTRVIGKVVSEDVVKKFTGLKAK